MQVTSLLLAAGIGAGFALSVELKKFIDDQITSSDDFSSTYAKILIRGLIASAFLSVTFLAMAILSVISSNNRSKMQPNSY